MEDFTEAKVFTGVPATVDQGGMMQPVAAPSAMITVDQARAVAEVQAAMVVARMSPRSEEQSYIKIMRACKRISLAEVAEYSYNRGDKRVTGPSIRIAEVLANAWGNITYGMREVSRKSGVSEVEAFAWDLETNTRVTRQFQVKHWRDTQKGGYELSQERDIYELTANQGSRRVRACILQIIPGDFVDAALDACRSTVKRGGGEPIEDRIRKTLYALDSLGVTASMVEKHLGHEVKTINADEFLALTTIYNSIKSGEAKREEFFDLKSEKGQGAVSESTESKEAETAKRTRKPREKKDDATASTQGQNHEAPAPDPAQDRFTLVVPEGVDPEEKIPVDAMNEISAVLNKRMIFSKFWSFISGLGVDNMNDIRWKHVQEIVTWINS